MLQLFAVLPEPAGRGGSGQLGPTAGHASLTAAACASASVKTGSVLRCTPGRALWCCMVASAVVLHGCERMSVSAVPCLALTMEEVLHAPVPAPARPHARRRCSRRRSSVLKRKSRRRSDTK